MFSWIQHALQVGTGRQVRINAAVHDKLNLWQHIIASLVKLPTQLQYIHPDKPTWIGVTEESLEGVGRV